MSAPTDDTLDRLKAVPGPGGWSEDPETLTPYLREWRGRYQGATPLLLRPASTREVAEVVRICAETGTAIVAQGGNTGLVGAQIPTGSEILLSLTRMNRISPPDTENNAIEVEAGAVLQEVQEAADEADRRFPLSLASEGSATIGGLISTNAGGVHVLRYGSMRDLVLGLEVVLPDGRVWNGLTRLRKDNRGPDLKQVFIGAEGTLGIVTAAVLKLFPRPHARAVAFLALPSVHAALKLLRLAEEKAGGDISAFELIPRIGLEFVLRHLPEARDPRQAEAPWYVLAEVETAHPGAEDMLTGLLEEAAAQELLIDGVIARNRAQEQELWRLRESLSEVQRQEGGSIKHDISVPVSSIGAFIERATEEVQAACPGARPVPFGHVGDGNVHFNVSQPLSDDMERDRPAFLARWEEIAEIVHGIALGMGGSISAEHGIGRMKRDELKRTDPLRAELLRSLKDAIDPKGIMNPGKVV
ncbi:MAG: FAD-binding oxidoreductase [bacterium]